MMSFVLTAIILVSLVFAAVTGNMGKLSNSILQDSTSAVRLSLELLGSMCLWSGVMNVAEKSGLTNKISKALSPIIRFLFKGIEPSDKAGKAIAMNMTANMLGLGNAATPLGLEAMKNMNVSGDIASDNMITFVVLNTASIQLIPATVAALRIQAGSQSPLDILPAVWITSITSVTVALLFSRLCRRRKV